MLGSATLFVSSVGISVSLTLAQASACSFKLGLPMYYHAAQEPPPRVPEANRARRPTGPNGAPTSVADAGAPSWATLPAVKAGASRPAVKESCSHETSPARAGIIVVTEYYYSRSLLRIRN